MSTSGLMESARKMLEPKDAPLFVLVRSPTRRLPEAGSSQAIATLVAEKSAEARKRLALVRTLTGAVHDGGAATTLVTRTSEASTPSATEERDRRATAASSL